MVEDTVLEIKANCSLKAHCSQMLLGLMHYLSNCKQYSLKL